jgi:hypothetical protein
LLRGSGAVPEAIRRSGAGPTPGTLVVQSLCHGPLTVSKLTTLSNGRPPTKEGFEPERLVRRLRRRRSNHLKGCSRSGLWRPLGEIFGHCAVAAPTSLGAWIGR